MFFSLLSASYDISKLIIPVREKLNTQQFQQISEETIPQLSSNSISQNSLQHILQHWIGRWLFLHWFYALKLLLFSHLTPHPLLLQL